MNITISDHLRRFHSVRGSGRSFQDSSQKRKKEKETGKEREETIHRWISLLLISLCVCVFPRRERLRNSLVQRPRWRNKYSESVKRACFCRVSRTLAKRGCRIGKSKIYYTIVATLSKFTSLNNVWRYVIDIQVYLLLHPLLHNFQWRKEEVSYWWHICYIYKGLVSFMKTFKMYNLKIILY